MKTLYLYPFNESIMLGIIKSLIKTEFFHITYSDMSVSKIKDFILNSKIPAFISQIKMEKSKKNYISIREI